MLYSDSEDDNCNIGKCFKLSYEQRFYGFIMFSGIGMFLSFIGTLLLFSMKLVEFAITYSFGSICMIMATFFLFGPVKQYKKIIKSTHRILAVSTYFITIILTLLAGLKWENVGLGIIFLLLQLVAYLWYTITSIPGGQTLCVNGCKSIIPI